MLGLEQIDDDSLTACTNLKIISKYDISLNNFDQEAYKRHNKVSWTSGINKRSVEEMDLSFMLTLALIGRRKHLTRP